MYKPLHFRFRLDQKIETSGEMNGLAEREINNKIQVSYSRSAADASRFPSELTDNLSKRRGAGDEGAADTTPLAATSPLRKKINTDSIIARQDAED